MKEQNTQVKDLTEEEKKAYHMEGTGTNKNFTLINSANIIMWLQKRENGGEYYEKGSAI